MFNNKVNKNTNNKIDSVKTDIVSIFTSLSKRNGKYKSTYQVKHNKGFTYHCIFPWKNSQQNRGKKFYNKNQLYETVVLSDIKWYSVKFRYYNYYRYPRGVIRGSRMWSLANRHTTLKPTSKGWDWTLKDPLFRWSQRVSETI